MAMLRSLPESKTAEGMINLTSFSCVVLLKVNTWDNNIDPTKPHTSVLLFHALGVFLTPSFLQYSHGGTLAILYEIRKTVH